MFELPPSRIIFHQPRCFFSEGNFPENSATCWGAQVVWPLQIPLGSIDKSSIVISDGLSIRNHVHWLYLNLLLSHLVVFDFVFSFDKICGIWTLETHLFLPLNFHFYNVFRRTCVIPMFNLWCFNIFGVITHSIMLL